MKPCHINELVRLGEIIVSGARVTMPKAMAEKTPLDIIMEGVRNYGRDGARFHCNAPECGHDFTLIREDDGDRYLPEFCPMCRSSDIEEFRE